MATRAAKNAAVVTISRVAISIRRSFAKTTTAALMNVIGVAGVTGGGRASVGVAWAVGRLDVVGAGRGLLRTIRA
jgi:hypothetical protein